MLFLTREQKIALSRIPKAQQKIWSISKAFHARCDKRKDGNSASHTKIYVTDHSISKAYYVHLIKTGTDSSKPHIGISCTNSSFLGGGTRLITQERRRE